MTMATVRSAWSASIEHTRGGVNLVISHRGSTTSVQWFGSIVAALVSAQARQFVWRRSGAIGSAVLYRGDLEQWEGND